jgi:hypothetical protein
VLRKKSYVCPVCRTPLSKKNYEEALGILDERQRHHDHEMADIQRRNKELVAKARASKEEGVQSERGRNKRLLAGRDRMIGVLRERLKQVQSGSTPQTEGLEFEEKLATRLRKEFRTDLIEHKGKGGDVLQHVRMDGKVIGVIIYECKRTPRIQTEHVKQAFRAKQSRMANFCVLVTTGTRRGHNGLSDMGGVLVISPLGVIPLVALLRAHMLELVRAQVGREKRARIADDLVRHIVSPQFRNPIEEIVQIAGELQDMVKGEARQHLKVWKKRWHYYQTMQWDTAQVQSNIRLVLHGKAPQALSAAKVSRLLLPGSSE